MTVYYPLQNIVKRSVLNTVEEVLAIKTLKLLEKVGHHSASFLYADVLLQCRVKSSTPIFFQIIKESNDSITQMKSIESLVSLSSKVDFGCKVNIIERQWSYPSPWSQREDWGISGSGRVNAVCVLAAASHRCLLLSSTVLSVSIWIFSEYTYSKSVCGTVS